MVALSVEHLPQEVQLTSGDGQDGYQFDDGIIFDFVFMLTDDFCLDDLSLFFEEFIFGYFFEAFSYVDKFGVQFIDLAFLG